MDNTTKNKLEKLILKMENTSLKLQVQHLEKKLSEERTEAQEKKEDLKRLENHYFALGKRYKIVLNKHDK